MSAIGLIMNLLLACLLVVTLGVGRRLNRRLKALRDSHDGFASAVRELNDAAGRAEQGLADLRAASDEALDILGERISSGRNLAGKLERLIEQAPDVSAAPARYAREPDEDRGAERRLGALLAAAREARPERAERHDPPARREPPPVQRPRFTVDDDIFDDEPLMLDRARRVAR
ncbi:MAG TPA: DUF6468 domain-containing protein [Phenylobacterium sp.]|nr:DUF6468 domain-containing protein [Phenylobacterium sp.]